MRISALVSSYFSYNAFIHNEAWDFAGLSAFIGNCMSFTACLMDSNEKGLLLTGWQHFSDIIFIISF